MRQFLFRFFMIVAFVSFVPSYADEATDLAKQTQNPVAKMISFPIQSQFNFGYGPHQNTQYFLNLKPVVPFSLTPHLNLITRTIIPLVHQPNIYVGRDDINGIGDINPTIFFSPVSTTIFIWGAGPTMILPTASNKQSGQGKWSVGPEFVMLATPGNWVLGVLAYNVWSVAGDSNRSNVSNFNLQYFLNYNLPKGWYINTTPTITANWYAISSDRWTIPWGIGAGHVFDVGTQPVNVQLQVYANSSAPKLVGANWTTYFTISFLYPK